MQPFNQNKTFTQAAPKKKIKFYSTNHNTYEAQNVSEHASHTYELPINFLEFI